MQATSRVGEFYQRASLLDPTQGATLQAPAGHRSQGQPVLGQETHPRTHCLARDSSQFWANANILKYSICRLCFPNFSAFVQYYY